MKKVLVCLALVAGTASASVISTVCRPSIMNTAGTEWSRIECGITTDDAGTFTVPISSTTSLRMRVNPDGTIASGDLPGILLAIQAAYRARIVAERANQTVEGKKGVGTFLMTPGQTE